jgi:hypothetical protein
MGFGKSLFGIVSRESKILAASKGAPGIKFGVKGAFDETVVYGCQAR